MSTVLAMQSEQPIGRILSIIGKGYLHLVRSKLRHLDIDRNYYALVLIDNHDGLITQQELSLLLQTDKVSIVRIVNYLSEKGYVKRTRKPDDHRKYCLMLTEKAQKAVPDIRKTFTEINNLIMKGFSESQMENLTLTIEKIRHNLTENIYSI